MASRKTIKRFSGCISKSNGGCEGPIVGDWIMTIGNLESRSEVCAAHALNFVKAGAVSWAMRKGLSAIGVSLPRGSPKFEFRFRKK